MVPIAQHPGGPPAGYPAELEEEVALGDGRLLWLRPIVPADALALAAEFAGADNETLYMRFFNPSFELTPERLEYLTEIDYHDHLALAVLAEDVDGLLGAAIGRYVARSSTEVEAAIVVKPEYRRLGIATLLLERLMSCAAAAGYESVVATYLSENRAVEALLGKFSFHRLAVEDGIAEARRRL